MTINEFLHSLAKVLEKRAFEKVKYRFHSIPRHHSNQKDPSYNNQESSRQYQKTFNKKIFFNEQVRIESPILGNRGSIPRHESQE